MTAATRPTHALRRASILVVAVAALALVAAAEAGASGSHLDAELTNGFGTDQPVTVDRVPAGQTFTGQPGWGFNLVNFGPNTVTNPTISVATGYPASDFQVNFVPPSSTPIIFTQDTLDPGQKFGNGLFPGQQEPLIAASFTTGCAWTRSTTPLEVPAAGGVQTVSVTAKCSDPAVRTLIVNMGIALPGATVIASTTPAGADPPTGDIGSGKQGGFGWFVGNVQTNFEYDFTATIQTPNPFGVAFMQKPTVDGFETIPLGGCNPCAAGSSVSFADPLLDGPVQGAGVVTYSVAEPDQSWSATFDEGHKLQLEGTALRDLLYTGPTTATPGQPVTITADWDGPQGQLGTPVTFTLGSQACTVPTGTATSDHSASCTMTFAQAPGTYTLKVSSAGDLSVYPVDPSLTFTLLPPSASDQCKRGLWRYFQIFENQGDCVSSVTTGGRHRAG